ncbi:MAG: hypothetical protein MJH11_02450 [Lentisphaeria bacterium]|nr:hypothetical protein [Lentisphaeria bacterium]
MRLKLCQFFSLVLVLLSCSCIELYQELEFTKDNAGKFKLKLSVSDVIYSNFVLGSKLDHYFDRKKGEALFKKSGVFIFNKYTVFNHENKKHLQIEGEISDMKKAMESKILGEFLYKFESGQKTVRLVFPKSKASKVDLKLEMKIKVNGKITKCNAEKQGKKEASWIVNEANFNEKQDVFIQWR